MTTEPTDTELRVKCAEAMGWGKPYQEGYGTYMPMANAPDYPSDPAAALTLVDKLADRGWRCHIDNGLDKTWEVTFSDSSGLCDDIYVPDPSFCRAICRAFLAVKGKDV